MVIYFFNCYKKSNKRNKYNDNITNNQNTKKRVGYEWKSHYSFDKSSN